MDTVPEYVVEVSDSTTGMRGILVIDSTKRGPGKGGIRMTPDVSIGELKRLAHTMTLKTALYKLPFGGAKSGIIWQGGSDEHKKELIESFAQAITMFTPKKYIAAPDVNVGEREIDWFVTKTKKWHSATGKPAMLCMDLFGKSGEACGIPHEYGSTGYGVACAAASATQYTNIDLKGASVAIEGFGNVGSSTFRYLQEMGARVVAVAEQDGTVYDPKGLDFDELSKLKESGSSLLGYQNGAILSHEELFSLPVDILIPAAVSDTINDKNKDTIQAKLIIEAANIPVSEKIEEELHRRGILIVPDFVANAGGVISSSAEHHNYNPKQTFTTIKRKIEKTTLEVLETSQKEHVTPRRAAENIAIERLQQGSSE